MALFVVIWHFQSRSSLSEQLVLKSRRIAAVSQISQSLASASAAEKGALTAITDRDSEDYVRRARAASVEVERARVELAELLKDGRDEERRLLAQFSKSFVALRRVDEELLQLAVKNTNRKATALAFGPAAEARQQMDAALSRIIAQQAASNSANARKALLVASDAQATSLRIEVLFPPHIAEESDKKMDELEAQMSEGDARVRKDLEELRRLLPANSEIESAAARYGRFDELRKQILALSRENTNVRALSISLNQRRTAAAACDDALTALERAIDAEPVPGLPPVARPR